MKKDQQLVDKGWHHMSALLDHEMPLTGQRRRRVIWWIAMIGGALLFSGWAYHFSQSKSNPEPVQQEKNIKPDVVTPQQHKPMASAESTEDNLSTETHATHSAANKETTASSVDRSFASATQKKSDAISTNYSVSLVEDKDLNQSDNSPAVDDLAGNSIEAEDDAQIVRNPLAEVEIASHANTQNDSPGKVNDTGNINVEGVDESIASIASPREVIALQQLSVISTSFNTASSPLTSLSIEPVRPKKFAMDALAASHFNADGNPLYGIESGIQAVWPANKKLRVRGGASYGYYNVDGISLGGLLQLDVNADAEEFNNGGYPDPNNSPLVDVMDVYGNTLAYSESALLTKKFHYLHIPVSLEYCFNHRLSAALGVKLSALLAAPARYHLNDARFASATAQTSSSRSFLYDYDILNKIDVAPMLSVSYMLAHHVWLDLAYTYGLRHYINSGSGNDPTLEDAAPRSDFHRSLSLGIRARVL